MHGVCAGGVITCAGAGHMSGGHMKNCIFGVWARALGARSRKG